MQGRVVHCRRCPALQLGLSAADGSAHGGGGFSSFRALRMLRVLRSLKLLREIKGLNRLLTLVLKASSTFVCMTACATPAAGCPGGHQGEHQRCHQHVSVAERADPDQQVAVYADSGQLVATKCSPDAGSNIVMPLPTSLLLLGSPESGCL